jgi:hypothetical protein
MAALKTIRKVEETVTIVLFNRALNQGFAFAIAEPTRSQL